MTERLQRSPMTAERSAVTFPTTSTRPIHNFNSPY
jgi:hypothetical protein